MTKEIRKFNDFLSNIYWGENSMLQIATDKFYDESKGLYENQSNGI